MNIFWHGPAARLLGLLLISQSAISWGQTPIELKIKAANGQIELSWPAEWISAGGVSRFPTYTVQYSQDLQQWQNIGQTLQGLRGAPPELKAVYTPAGLQAFYRIVGKVGSATPAGLAASGDEVFGNASQFATELLRIGQISPAEFASRYGPQPSYLPAITWDPTTAQYWSLFNQNTNFQLNATELALFKKNGFVVSQRLGS